MSAYLPIKLLAWAMEQELKPGPKLVLIMLSQHANEETGQCNPSVRTLAKRTGFGETAVRAHLADLVDNGLVERVRNRRGDGSLGGYFYGFPALGFRANHNRNPTLGPPSESDGLNEGSTPLNQVVSSTDVELTLSAEDFDAADPVIWVYNRWREARGKTRSTYAKISPARRKKIEARLKEFTIEDLMLAIEGVGKDPWPDRAQHDDITVIFRSREQVERFLELNDGRAAQGRGVTAREIEALADEAGRRGL